MNPNCIHYAHGTCAHPFARRAFFGNRLCLFNDRRDHRIKGCSVQVEHPRPAPPPKKP